MKRGNESVALQDVLNVVGQDNARVGEDDDVVTYCANVAQRVGGQQNTRSTLGDLLHQQMQ